MIYNDPIFVQQLDLIFRFKNILPNTREYYNTLNGLFGCLPISNIPPNKTGQFKIINKQLTVLLPSGQKVVVK